MKRKEKYSLKQHKSHIYYKTNKQTERHDMMNNYDLTNNWQYRKKEIIKQRMVGKIKKFQHYNNYDNTDWYHADFNKMDSYNQ